jgi:hypothetical protein
LWLDLVLNNQSLALVVDLLGELRRDGMVSCDVLDNQTLVANHAVEHGRFLDSPFTDVGPILLRLGVLLLGVRGSPSRVPIGSELLEEGSFNGSRLIESRSSAMQSDGGEYWIDGNVTYGEGRLLHERSSVDLLLSLLSMSLAHQSGRGDEGASDSCVETHDGRRWDRDCYYPRISEYK